MSFAPNTNAPLYAQPKAATICGNVTCTNPHGYHVSRLVGEAGSRTVAWYCGLVCRNEEANR